MTNLNKALIAALGIQAILIALTWRSGSVEGIVDYERIVSFEPDAVNRIELFAARDDADKGEQAPELVLVRVGDGWRAESHFGHPIKSAMVSSLLSNVAAMKARSPMAKTEVRQRQLRVADNHFNAKAIFTGKAKTVIFVGAPGPARTTAVRVEGHSEVFAVSGISSGSLTSDVDSWVEDIYFEINAAEIDSFEVSNSVGVFSFERGPQGWDGSLDGVPLDNLNRETVETLAQALAKIPVLSVADPSKKKSTPDMTAVITMKAPSQPASPDAGPMQSSVGDVYTIDLSIVESRYIVGVRNNPNAVTVRKGSLRIAVELTAAALKLDEEAIKPKAPDLKPVAPPGQKRLTPEDLKRLIPPGMQVPTAPKPKPKAPKSP